MKPIESNVITTAPAFLARRESYLTAVATLNERRAEAVRGGSEKARKLHKDRGQLLPRERIAALIDLGSEFIEIGQLAGADMYEGVPPGATIITGVGKVNDRSCMLIVNDATVKGGTGFGMTTKKHVRAQLFAWRHRLPCITMVQSGGGFLPDMANMFPAENHFGHIMKNQILMSADGIPQIATVHGPSTAGGAYIPALCDEVVIIRNQGSMFLGSPQLVFAATGEVIDKESLGGAEMHCRISGVTDHLAENDSHALEITRDIVSHLGEAAKPRWTRVAVEPPLYDADDLYGLARGGVGGAGDCREIIARIVDGSRLQEFKALFGPTLVCGFVRLQGFEVGVLASNGELTGEAAAKGAHFIQLCCQRDIPLLFLVDCPGLSGDIAGERRGFGRDIAKLLNAVANADVPKFTVITGEVFGGAYFAMCGRAMKPDALLMWPQARAGATPDVGEQEAGALHWARHLWCDMVVDPHQTRAVLGSLLELAAQTPPKETEFAVFRM